MNNILKTLKLSLLIAFSGAFTSSAMSMDTLEGQRIASANLITKAKNELPSSIPIKISHPDKGAIYLLGTIHCTKVEDEYSLPSSTIDFIQQNCDRIFFESIHDQGYVEEQEIFKSLYQRYAENRIHQRSTPILPPIFKSMIDDLLTGFSLKDHSDGEEFVFLSSVKQQTLCMQQSMVSKAHQEQIETLEKEMHPEDLITIQAFLETLTQNDSLSIIEENNVPPPQEYMEPEYIDPVDAITWALYSNWLKALQTSKELTQYNMPGTETILEQEFAHKDPTISFLTLENRQDIFEGFRTQVGLHIDKSDPYTKWLVPLQAIQNDGLTETPEFLAKIYQKGLYDVRENKWFPQILKTLENSVGNKSALFAIGDDHIKSLVQKFKEIGCDISA